MIGVLVLVLALSFAGGLVLGGVGSWWVEVRRRRAWRRYTGSPS